MSVESVAAALRNSSKGQLRYGYNHNGTCKHSEFKHEIDPLSPPPLSRCHKENKISELNLSFGLDSSNFKETNAKNDFNENSCRKDSFGESEIWPQSPVKSYQLSDEESEKADLSKDDLHETSLSTLPSRYGKSARSYNSHEQSKSRSVLPLSNHSSGAIVNSEKDWESYGQLLLLERLTQFDDHEKALASLMGGKCIEMKNRLEYRMNDRQRLIDMKHQEGAEETQKMLQRRRENHEEHQKKIVTKKEEIERQRIHLEQEERRRVEMRAKNLQTLRSIFQQIDDNRLAFIQLQESSPSKAQSNEIVNKFRAALERVCTGLATQVQAAEQTSGSLDELISKFEEYQVKSLHAVEFLKRQIEEAEARTKQEEDEKKEEEKKMLEKQHQEQQARKLEEEAAADSGVQALGYALREYKSKLQTITQLEAGFQNFIENTQMKKYRFDLQRAINTPINAISAVNGSHLRDKLQRLHLLLSGQSVDVSGKRVSAKDVPEALPFCQNLVAKMLVRKGEEQVTSKHESAFAIGAVVVGLWADFPIVGELFMGHLQTLCPYVLPFYPIRQEGQSSLDYHRALGYKIAEDGSIEEQDKFLRRMSGIMRLYCACLVATPTKGAASPHPHGVENAWNWLGRTLNLEPHPDITAVMIYDLLAVTGHALLLQYRVQFAKLLYILCKQYLPKLKSVSVTSAAVGRLEIFLETAMKNSARIPAPDGILSQNFWLS